MENREIKFRAWDESRKRMVYSFEKLTDHKKAVELFFNDEDEMFAATMMDNGDWDELTLMQFTGLHDREGKEIYEGDAVKTSYYSGTPGKWSRLIGVIKFTPAQFKVYGTGKYEGLIKELHPLSEIIGNIYENPELIAR